MKAKTAKAKKLNNLPARELTDRECCKIIGGLIAGLTTMTTTDTIRVALRWWVTTDSAWEPFREHQSQYQKFWQDMR